MGVCTGKIGKEEYAETIEQALAFLQGNSKDIVSIMEKKMLEYAEKTEFEKAARLRDTSSFGRKGEEMPETKVEDYRPGQTAITAPPAAGSAEKAHVQERDL